MRGRGGAVVLAALAPASALAADPGGWYPFGPAKWLVVAALVPLGLLLLARQRPVELRPVPTAAAAVLVAWLGLAAVVGEDPRYAWTGTPERHLGVWTWALLALALVAGQLLDPERDGSALRIGLAVAGLGVGAVASAEVVLEALGRGPALLAADAGRLTGPFGSAAYLGAATALLLPAVAGIAVDRGAGRRCRRAAAVAVPLLVVACVGSGARAAWLGLVVAGAVAAWVGRARLAGTWRRVGRATGVDGGRRSPAAVLVAAVAGAALLVVAAGLGAGPVAERVGTTFDGGAAGGGPGRVDEWRVGAAVARAHPLTGVGPEGYRVAFGEGVDEAYERAHGRDPQPDRGHSAPLDVALVGGIPALAAWSVVVVSMAVAAVAALGRGRPWLAGVATGVLAFLVGSLLLFPTAELDPVVWLFGGLLVGWAHVPTGRTASSASTSTSTSTAVPVSTSTPAPAPASELGIDGGGDGRRGRSGARRAGASVGLVALGLLVVAGAVDGSTALVADRHARVAVGALAAGSPGAAVEAIERATALRPDVVRHHLLAARARVAADQGTLAGLAAVDDALAVSPGDPIAVRRRLELLVERARATSVPAHADVALADAERLLAGDPLDAAVWLQAGSAALLAGDEAAARAAWRRADELAPASAAALVNLALVDLEAGDLVAARARADQARERAPGDPRVDALEAVLAGAEAAAGAPEAWARSGEANPP